MKLNLIILFFSVFNVLSSSKLIKECLNNNKMPVFSNEEINQVQSYLLTEFQKIGKNQKFRKLISDSDNNSVQQILKLFHAAPDSRKQELLYLFNTFLMDDSTLPVFSGYAEYELLFKSLALDISPEIKAFAQLNWKQIKKTHKDLSLRLKYIGESKSFDLNYTKKKDGLVSFVWYPHNPEVQGPLICSHAKLIVDGEAWSTMGSFDKYEKSVEVFRRNGRIYNKNSFYEFVIKPNPEELERIKYILNNNDIERVSALTCVQGACGALRESGVIDIPFPFRSVPSLAALYLKLSSQFPGKVLSVKFNGKSQFGSILNTNVIVEGVIVATLSLVGGMMIYKTVNDLIETE